MKYTTPTIHPCWSFGFSIKSAYPKTTPSRFANCSGTKRYCALMSRQAPSTPSISTLLPVQLNADVPSKRTAIEGMVESPWRQGEEALMTPWYKPASQVCVPEARLEGECVLTALPARSDQLKSPG